jgi:S1-C subfamily serine protease
MSESQLRALNMSRDQAGIRVLGVPATGAAAAAGIKEGDIITKINGVNTSSVPELMEQISRYKPGDKVSINYTRNDKEYTASAILKNLDGNTGIVKPGVLDYLGAELRPLPKEIAQRLGMEGGVMVTNVNSGIIKKQTNMKSNFVILKAGNAKIESVDALKSALQGKKSVRLEGFYMTDRQANIYYYDLDLSNSVAF